MEMIDLLNLFSIDDEDKDKKSSRLKEKPRLDSMADNTTVFNSKVLPDISKINTADDDIYEWFPTAQWMNWDRPAFKNALLDSQINTESRGDPTAVSSAGAAGLTQFMPITWTEAKRQKWIPTDASRFDPNMSLQAQTRFMDYLYNKPDIKNHPPEERMKRTLASYNAGHGSFRSALRKAKKVNGYWLDFMSKETKKYIPQILNNANKEFYGSKGRYVSRYDRSAFD